MAGVVARAVSATRKRMIDSFIKLLTEYGNSTWVALCVVLLFLGFALCVGNFRRQVLIGVIIVFWGGSLTFYDSFYVMPIARYAWFPYWVLLETILLLAVFYAEPISNYIAKKYNFKKQKITKKELQQELIVCALCLLSIFTDIGQLGSALAGTGRITGEYYDHANRLLLSLSVIVLIAPGKKGLLIIRELVNEKVAALVARRHASHRSINKP